MSLLDLENLDYKDYIMNSLHGLKDYFSEINPISIAGVVLSILYVAFYISLKMQTT